MSKYLGVVLLSFLVSTAYGMEDGALVPTSNRTVQQKILAEFSELQTEFHGGSILNVVGLGTVGDTYVKKTDVVSFLRTKVADRLVRITEDLSQTSSRLEESAVSLASAASVERALREAQRELDETRHALRNSQFAKEAAELVITRERESRIALLTAKDGAEADSIAQKMRVRDLEDHVKEKDRIIAELRLAVAEKAKLTEDKQRFKSLLESKLGVDTPRDGDEITDLEALISKSEARELHLQSEIVRLEKEKLEKETLIEQYKVSVHMGDPYNYILGLIEQPISEISDKRLKAEIFCVMTRTGQNLDQLSVGKPEKIVAKLIRASRPTKDAYRRAGKIRDTDPTYRDYGLREIGNDFVSLGWGGPTLKPDDYFYVGSALERNINSAASILG